MRIKKGRASLGAALLAAQKRVGRAVMAAVGASGLNVQQNNAASAGQMVFHAGTSGDEGRITASGGRVLTVTARGATLAEAQGRAYAMVDAIDWPEGFCRRDIGWRAL